LNSQPEFWVQINLNPHMTPSLGKEVALFVTAQDGLKIYIFLNRFILLLETSSVLQLHLNFFTDKITFK